MRTEIVIAAGVVLAAAALVVLRRAANRPASTQSDERTTTFVFVQIPESIQPTDRGEKYEDPLDAALKRERLGEVTGAAAR